MSEQPSLAPTQQSKDGILPGLNALRFFAASSVLLSHIEQQKAAHGIPSLWPYTAVQFLGEGAVTFFFVLSGFLITYLLLNEKGDFGTVSIKLFYIRRALRILPLYYFVLILAFFVIPQLPFLDIPLWSEELHENFWRKFILYALLLPQLACSIYPTPVPYASQAWSIGVEEIFYLFWPWLLRGTKYLVLTLLGVVVVFAFLIFPLLGFLGDPLAAILEKFFYFTRLGCIAIGALAAIVARKPSSFRNFAYHRFTQIFVFALLPCFALASVSLPRGTHELYSLLFAGVIVNVSTNPGSILKLQQNWLDRCGKISYGIYMYHLIAIVLSIHLFDSPLGGEFQRQLSILAGSFLLAIFFAELSYRLFEERFLRMRKKYSPTATLSESQSSSIALRQEALDGKQKK